MFSTDPGPPEEPNLDTESSVCLPPPPPNPCAENFNHQVECKEVEPFKENEVIMVDCHGCSSVFVEETPESFLHLPPCEDTVRRHHL